MSAVTRIMRTGRKTKGGSHVTLISKNTAVNAGSIVYSAHLCGHCFLGTNVS